MKRITTPHCVLLACLFGLAMLGCADDAGETSSPASSQEERTETEPAEDDMAPERYVLAGWIGKLETPVLMDFTLTGDDVHGTLTSAKVGKPLQLNGTLDAGDFILEETLGSKTTGYLYF